MKKLIFLLLLMTLCAWNAMQAQDVIHKKNGETIQAKVMEVDEDKVKYRIFDEPDGPTYTIDKSLLQKIVFQSGRTEVFQDNFTNPELYTDQRKHAIKIGFLSPLFGNTNFTYERNIKPGRSFETKVGFIGLGKNLDNRDAAGVFFSATYKFYRTPDYYMRGMRYAHILKGGYVKPELTFGFYEADLWGSDFNGERERRSVNYGAVMLNLGKQWVYSDIFLIDMFFGFGYGFDNNDNIADYHYNITKTGDGLNFAIGAGLNIGILLK